MAVNINDSGSMRNAILNRKAEILNFVDFINGSFDRIRRDLLHKSVLQDIGSIARDTYAHIIEAVGKRGTEVRLTGSQGNYPLALYSPASQLPRVPKHVDRSGLYRSGLATTGNFADPRFIEAPFRGAARTDTNVFYRESALPNELFNFPLATMEQAEQMREDDEESRRHRYAMSHIMWGKRRDVLRKKRQGDINWVNSRMSDYDRQMLERTEYFGGGPEGRVRAEQEYREETQRRMSRAQARHSIRERQARLDAFKEFKWLRPIARNIPAIGRNLPVISRALHTAARTPVIGSLVKHPVMAGMGLLAGITHGIFKNARYNASLTPLSDMLGVPLSGLKSIGHSLSRWGGSEKDYANAMQSFGAAQGKLFMGLGGTEHLEQLAMAGIDIRGSGKGGLLTMQEKIERVSSAIRNAYMSGDKDKVLALASVGGFSSPMVEAAIRGMDLGAYANDPWTNVTTGTVWARIGEKINQLFNSPMTETLHLISQSEINRSGVDPYTEYAKSFLANSAAVSADSYMSNGGGQRSGNVTVQINTLQTNASSYKDLMTDIVTIGITDPSTRKAIVDSFDSLGE